MDTNPARGAPEAEVITGPKLADQSVAELLSGYAAILAELRRRQVVRTNNAPVGDYAEWLVARALGGRLADSTSAKSYDLVLPDGARVQVKSRLVSDPPTRGQLQTSPFRSFDFDFACFVLLRSTDYLVARAVLTPVQIVQSLAGRSEHVNGWRVIMNPALIQHVESRDVTNELSRAALES